MFYIYWIIAIIVLALLIYLYFVTAQTRDHVVSISDVCNNDREKSHPKNSSKKKADHKSGIFISLVVPYGQIYQMTQNQMSCRD